MKRINFILFQIVLSFLLFNSQSLAQYFDNFEYYFLDQQLACQSHYYWTTWSSLPCDPVEDSYISTNFSYSGTKSVKIVQNNDLVNLLDSINYPFYGLSFVIYIPSGKAGYFNLLSGFTPNPSQWGMECYFDQGGTGRLLNGSTINFTWTPDSWQFFYIELDLMSDWAQVWINNVQINNWQWSRGGSINLRLDAIDFFGATANDEMYIDDFIFWDGCLSCGPPNPATGLTAIEVSDPEPKVKLNWQGSMFGYQFHIVRKDGYPNDPGNYEYVGTTLANITEYIDSLVIVNQRYTYGVVAHGYYGYSDTSNLATILVIIPVELTSFTYEMTAQNDVLLSWTTATETNNQGFEIERSQDSKIEGSKEWETAGFVPGYGTTTEPQFYSFIDASLQSGKYEYRLKQIDFDGSFEYSEIIEVEIGTPKEFSLAQNYPNPFNPKTNIEFRISDFGFVTLKVYDILGNEIATLVNEEKPAGEYEVEFDATSLTSGIYYYRLTAGNHSSTKKMILMR